MAIMAEFHSTCRQKELGRVVNWKSSEYLIIALIRKRKFICVH